LPREPVGYAIDTNRASRWRSRQARQDPDARLAAWHRAAIARFVFVVRSRDAAAAGCEPRQVRARMN